MSDELFDRAKAVVGVMCFDAEVSRAVCLSRARAMKVEIDKMMVALRSEKAERVEK